MPKAFLGAMPKAYPAQAPQKSPSDFYFLFFIIFLVIKVYQVHRSGGGAIVMTLNLFSGDFIQSLRSFAPLAYYWLITGLLPIESHTPEALLAQSPMVLPIESHTLEALLAQSPMVTGARDERAHQCAHAACAQSHT